MPARTYNGLAVSDAFDVKDPRHVENIEATLKELGGRTPASIFGRDVPLDRVKITQWSPDTCGCVLDYLWTLDDPEDSREHVAHRVVKACTRHAHLESAHDDHFAEVLAQNRHKNRAVGAAAELAGVPIFEVGWSIDDDGTLALEHPKLTRAHVAKLASIPELKGRKVRAA